MKKILCINYSQSGQLHDIVENFVSPLDNVEIDRVKIEMKDPFPFPWDVGNFYNIMPETINEEPIPLKAFSFKEEKYDLIVLGYQPWFLSPSLPTSSLLKDESFKRRLNNTPVITVQGARNMWLNAQESVVKLIQDAGGRIVGNIPLVDRAPNHLSAVSIAHWMMTGKKTRKWGIFPKPGVSDEDIAGISTFGKYLNEVLHEGTLDKFQDYVVKNGGLRVNTNILFIEGKAKKIFRLWTKLILKKEAEGKSRRFWVKFFRIYLNTALFGVAPILLTFYTIFVRPFSIGAIRRKKEYFAYLGMK